MAERLFIAEKPTLAKAIATILAENTAHAPIRERYIITIGTDVIFMLQGHVFEMAEPQDYDPAWESWRASPDILKPPSGQDWKLKEKPIFRDRLRLLSRLLKDASVIVHTGDADREGQLLVQEILERYQVKKPTLRLWITDTNPGPVRRALETMSDNRDALYQGHHHEALARSRIDWMMGLSLTRAATNRASLLGHDGVLHFGRIKTPLIHAVVTRDQDIARFKPVDYFVLEATVETRDRTGSFTARVAIAHEAGDPAFDDENRLIGRDKAEEIGRRLVGATGTITAATDDTEEEKPPLLPNLTDIQIRAAKLYGYSLQETLDIMQMLYEQHQLVTYPRTDSNYASVERHADAAASFVRLSSFVPAYRLLVEMLDASRMTESFNDEKVAGHHALVPTEKVISEVEYGALPEPVRRIHDIVVRLWFAQFMGPARYRKQRIEIGIPEPASTLTTVSRSLLDAGWKSLYQNQKDTEESETPTDTGFANEQTALPACRVGASVTVAKTDLASRSTTPPRPFTDASLARFMERYGLGTPATKAPIVLELFEKGYFNKQGRNIRATELAQKYAVFIPDSLKDPRFTAEIETRLGEVRKGRLAPETLLAQSEPVIAAHIAFIRSHSPAGIAPPTPCPKCGGGSLGRRSGKNGPFWACSDRDACGATFPDEHGKPQTAPRDTIICPTCNLHSLRRLNSQKGGFFWGCTGFRAAPLCKATFEDEGGKPQFERSGQQKRQKSF